MRAVLRDNSPIQGPALHYITYSILLVASIKKVEALEIAPAIKNDERSQASSPI